jgi:pyruvate-formate lyase-activating enzyme
MAVSSWGKFVVPELDTLMRLPRGNTVFTLPGRRPVGFNPAIRRFETVEKFQGREVFAAASFLMPALLRVYTPAYVIKKKIKLPFWAYNACGFYQGIFYTTAVRVDRRIRQSPVFYDNKIIEKKVNYFLSRYPSNRLYQHLAHCALNYNCLAAKNLFMQRWEAPLPTARFCNARCLGCLSMRDSDCLSSHQRIDFSPRPEEIAQVAINHLDAARDPLVSFGQGCEGEPLLEAENIAAAITLIRDKTGRGTINMNTNASIPGNVDILCRAGIDSFRVSLNSPTEKFYKLYFKPRGYKFRDCLRSIAVAKKYNKFVSVNLFIFPGFSDRSGEISALIKFIKENGIDMLQCRNLNLDPQLYLDTFPGSKAAPRGIVYLLKAVSAALPKLKIGYFNLPKEEFTRFENVIK